MALDRSEHGDVPAAGPPGLGTAHRDDAAAIGALEGVMRVHGNESHWWNHASFVLPLLGFIGLTALGLVIGSAEATGFGVFLGVVLLLQLPIVYFSWRGTATAIVLTRTGAVAMHRGRTLQQVRWTQLERIERVETFGNVRWKLMETAGEHLTVDGEIADVRGLVDSAHELSGLPRDGS